MPEPQQLVRDVHSLIHSALSPHLTPIALAIFTNKSPYIKDVRFKNQGLDAIEVQDNGSGISPANYESIALKHYTSKLSSYDDLSTLETFGFRGEALSSLCALSNFYVTTCTQKEAPRARKLEFETSGKLKSTSIVSGQKGTTVVVENLFRNLPVRRRELERNIKREWNKVIALLNQYACIQTGVKFTVSQQPTKGKKMVLFSTKGNPTTRENIINVFGVKTISALVPLDLKLELIPTTGALGKGKGKAVDSTTAEVRVKGHVSRPVHGEGRQTPDRQMFYINGRPCGLPQFAKVFNEVYRSYNMSQVPFIFADIQLDTHLYDVNVSPDKRTILLHDQGQMLDNLRESLIELFEMQDVTIPIARTQTQRLAGTQAQTPSKRGVGSRSSTPASGQGAKRPLTVAERTSAGKLTTSNLSREDIEAGPESEEEQGEGEDEQENGQEGDGSADETDPSNKVIHRSASSSSPASTSKSQTDNLLARWLERKSGAREQPNPQQGSKDLGLVGRSKAVADSSQEVGPGEDDTSDIQPTPCDDDEAAVSYQPGQITQESNDEMDVDNEEPVTAIPPPSRVPASKFPGFVSASRVMANRSATQEVATITIGDHSVTSMIGSAAKRPRLGTGESGSSKPVGSSAAKTGSRIVPVPSFGGRLSQMFSASAVKRDGESSGNLKIETEEVELPMDEEDDEKEDEDKERDDEVEEDEDELFVSQPGDTGDHPGVDTMDTKSSDEEAEDEEDNNEEEEEGGKEEDHDTSLSNTRGLQISRGNSPSIHGEADDHHHDHEDDEYIDETEKKKREDKKVQQMIDAAEAQASNSIAKGEERTKMLMKGRQKRKDATLNLVQHMKVDTRSLSKSLATWMDHLPPPPKPQEKLSTQEDDNATNSLEAEGDVAEQKLALKISKSDFAKMRVVGQFNLGFVLAVREKNIANPDSTPSLSSSSTQKEPQDDDELFIIDQHASDEKYNFERLQATTTVQSQRLVQPKPLELTAVEEEIIIENIPALESNGFSVHIDTSGEKPVGSRVILTSLPLSRETTFSVADLEELIFLLGENPSTNATTIPRPSKVRKMFAMRACRSSIMIGKALSKGQMEKVVRHMGEMEKPWNCPHGRPTMRHLCGLGTAWDGRVWREGDWVANGDEGGSEEEVADGDDYERRSGTTRRRTDWKGWVREKRGGG